MEINGLPLHPLAVHGAVVFGPLAALAALAYVVPALRDKARWPMLALAVVAGLSVIGAYLSGDSFREANAFFNDPTLPATAQIDEHEDLGTILLWVAFGFAALAALNAWLHTREGALRLVANGVLALGAVAVLVLTVLTGDAGAKAVWDGFEG